MLDLNNIKISYYNSILIISIVIIIIIYFYFYYIKENFDNNMEYNNNIKIKTNQCNNCKLIGNNNNSFYNIYKQSLMNSFKNIF